jgi:hypothetical protein
MLGILSAGAAGIVAVGGGAAAADQASHAGHASHEHDGHIKILGHCIKVCNEAAHHCLQELSKGGSHAMEHVKSHEAAMDCQAFCVLTATLMARCSEMGKYAHRACADACRDCASACEGQRAEIMQECVKACRECEAMCRKMSA